MFLHFLQTNTFQAVIVTDGSNSFAIFIYRCGDIQWDFRGFGPGFGGATIGFGASSEFFSNHRLALIRDATSIDCINAPENQFFTVLYGISNLVEGKIGIVVTALDQH